MTEFAALGSRQLRLLGNSLLSVPTQSVPGKCTKSPFAVILYHVPFVKLERHFFMKNTRTRIRPYSSRNVTSLDRPEHFDN